MTARRRRPCSLCLSFKSGAKGEHILPRWYIKKVYPSLRNGNSENSERWTVYRDDIPVRRKGGQLDYPYVMLPCCRDCNNHLATRFEDPLRPAVEDLLDGANILEDEAARDASLWFLKTILLLTHKDAEPLFSHDLTGPHMIAWRDETDGRTRSQYLYRWMIEEGDPPKDLTLWIHRSARETDPSGNSHMRAAGSSNDRFDLPEVHADGKVYEGRAARVGFGEYRLTLVHHPGWDIDCPLLLRGEAAQLWPSTGPLNLADLPTIDSWPLHFVAGWRLDFDSGTFDRARLPHLSVGLNLMMIPGAKSAAAPLANAKEIQDRTRRQYPLQ